MRGRGASGRIAPPLLESHGCRPGTAEGGTPSPFPAGSPRPRHRLQTAGPLPGPGARAGHPADRLTGPGPITRTLPPLTQLRSSRRCFASVSTPQPSQAQDGDGGHSESFPGTGAGQGLFPHAPTLGGRDAQHPPFPSGGAGRREAAAGSMPPRERAAVTRPSRPDYAVATATPGPVLPGPAVSWPCPGPVRAGPCPGPAGRSGSAERTVRAQVRAAGRARKMNGRSGTRPGPGPVPGRTEIPGRVRVRTGSGRCGSVVLVDEVRDLRHEVLAAEG